MLTYLIVASISDACIIYPPLAKFKFYQAQLKANIEYILTN